MITSDRSKNSGNAAALLRAGIPRSRLVHLISQPKANTVLVVEGSKLFEVDSETFFRIGHLAEMADGEPALNQLLLQLGLDCGGSACGEVPVAPPVRSLSLAVAQKCNLGCSYCYANQGDFGGAPKNMSAETALRAVDLLFSEVQAGERVNLAFLGGEPLINRPVLQQATERAVKVASDRGVRLTFSITTNGTLVTPDDGEFFEFHGFAVTISLDGLRRAHDALRPFKGGDGSYDRILANIRPLLRRQRRMQVSARVTVTPTNLELPQILDEFIALGFHSVGFSPLLNAVNGQNEMDADQWETMLGQMVECCRQFEQRLLAGQRYPFANFVTALREIHKGTHRPYPCGAGAGYFGVSADGELAACHRFVGNPEGTMGNLVQGIDRQLQAHWLSKRHVHHQEPCHSCWARYLCGGGCHHEVMQRGRSACDYIRGWLHYCLEAYGRLIRLRPEWFGETSSASIE
jgi:uncharacterized protein